MLSLSLGRDGCVKAAAPAPRIECALLRCAAFVAVQLFFVGNTRSCTIGDAGCPPLCSVQRLLCEGSEVCTQAVQAPKRSKMVRINFALTSCL